MALAHLRREERIGLGVAIAAHAALLVALAIQANREPAYVPLPPRMVVSLAEDVALESTAPEPAAEAQAAVAPTLTEEPKPAPPAEKSPEPVRTSAIPATRPPPVRTPPPPPVTQRSGGGSRLGEDFLAGQGSSESAADSVVPASQIGAAEKASIQQAIARQLRPYWKPPSGAGAEDLVTFLAFDLNPDGSLAGRPQLVRQLGINDTNRPQAGRHLELAIRAVQLAAPFDLPPKYYNVWKHIRTSRFDWNLSQ